MSQPYWSIRIFTNPNDAKNSKPFHLLKHYEISDELQHNLYNFYNHELAHSLSDSDTEIIDKLPPKLQETLRRHISCHTLSRVDLFSMDSEDELATLGQRLQTVVYSPGDEIISIGTPGREMYLSLTA